MEIRTEILINAIPYKIWTILTDFDKYPDWNPFIKYVKGTVKTGSQIEVRIEPPGAKAMVFKPKSIPTSLPVLILPLSASSITIFTNQCPFESWAKEPNRIFPSIGRDSQKR